MNDPNKPYRILAVCLGNICRSPLAEELLRRAAQKRQLYWEVDSAGMGGWHVGSPPHQGSQQIAKHYGLDISQQRCRQVRQEDLAHYDLVIAMDSSNWEALQNLATGTAYQPKIKLLLEYAQLDAQYGPDVFDPYFDKSRFEEVFLLIEEAAERIAERWAAEVVD